MATIKPVSFNRLPEIDENDGKVILHDGSQLGRSTKELGEIIDDRLRTGLEDGKQYAMTTSGWKDVVIPEVDLTPYAYSAGLEADKQFVMTDNGWAEVDLSPYALSADVDSKAEEISSWANETFLTDADLNDYALSADVDRRLEDTSAWANDTFVTSVNLEADKQYVMTNSGWQEIPKNTDIVADEYNPAAPPQTYGTDPGLEHYCIYNLKLYRCKEVCIGENDPWNPNYWEETTISEELYKNNMMNDNDIDNILNELD